MREDEEVLHEASEAVLRGALSRIDYQRLWRKVMAERLTQVVAGEPLEHAKVPEPPKEFVPKPDTAPPIPWASPCTDYSAHRSQHVIRDGFAHCLVCTNVVAPPSVSPPAVGSISGPTISHQTRRAKPFSLQDPRIDG
jgi:hypothetical protein